jgi:ribosomal-protein-alanine N-acetyltransferase
MLAGIDVLERGGAVVGYAFVVGYTLRHLVVDPAQRGRGFGRALLRAAMKRVAAAGYDVVELNVHEDNRPARALYERAGLRVLGPELGVAAEFRMLRMEGSVAAC